MSPVKMGARYSSRVDLAVKSDPLVAVSKTDLVVGVVPYEPSLLSHPVTADNELM